MGVPVSVCVLNNSQKFAHALPIDARPSRLLLDDHTKPEETARQAQQAEQPKEKAMCLPCATFPFARAPQPFNSSATGLAPNGFA